jgi:hypothetical protein
VVVWNFVEAGTAAAANDGAATRNELLRRAFPDSSLQMLTVPLQEDWQQQLANELRSGYSLLVLAWREDTAQLKSIIATSSVPAVIFKNPPKRGANPLYKQRSQDLLKKLTAEPLLAVASAKPLRHDLY